MEFKLIIQIIACEYCAKPSPYTYWNIYIYIYSKSCRRIYIYKLLYLT